MDIRNIKIKLKNSEQFLKERFLVKKIGVFGSYSRGEQRKGSDVDILVEFFDEPSFFKFIRLEDYLKKLLGIKVDLVMKNSLKPNIGKYILEEVIYI
ncbi:MAG: nucleotidyltransferase family protein [Patescibacteria group bacterium]